ncbi:MAG: hypothetical protein KKF50_03260 [Nanoarchaeota archaeon]|nr:hypothetical protein [Nanoarchaeota archaeon]
MKKYIDNRFLTDELAQELFPSEDPYESKERLTNYVKKLNQRFEGSGQHMPSQSALSIILNELIDSQL